MKEYTIKAPSFESNTLKSFKAEDRESLKEKLRDETNIDAFEVVSEKEVN